MIFKKYLVLSKLKNLINDLFKFTKFNKLHLMNIKELSILLETLIRFLFSFKLKKNFFYL